VRYSEGPLFRTYAILTLTPNPNPNPNSGSSEKRTFRVVDLWDSGPVPIKRTALGGLIIGYITFTLFMVANGLLKHYIHDVKNS